MDSYVVIFQIVILILSAVAHEVSHGYAALWFGDETALRSGRLTINPFKHLDLFGSIILPLLLIVSHSPIGLAWAKPVPYNPLYFKNIRLGTRIVAVAGIFTNFVLALIFGLAIRFLGPQLGNAGHFILSIVVITNLGLAIFNLIPVPPLDGSKILFSFLPVRYERFLYTLEQYGFMLIFGLLIVLHYLNIDPVSALVFRLFTLITGITI